MASSSQITESYAICRKSIVHDQPNADIILDNYEPQARKTKIFMSTNVNTKRKIDALKRVKRFYTVFTRVFSMKRIETQLKTF